MKTKISITVDESLLKQADRLVDHVYIRNRSQAIEHLIKKGVGERRIAVVLAGGPEEKIRLSTGEYRAAAKLQNTSLIQRNVKKLRQHGFREIFVIARPAVLTAIFDLVKDGSDYNVHINYVEEKQSKGTAETLRHIKGKVNTTFLAVYGHILFDKLNLEELWQQHINGTAVATIMLTTAAIPSEKGTVKMEGSKVLEFVQKPKQSDSYLVFSPLFVAEEELLNYDGSSLEYDVFPKLASQGLLAGHVSPERELHIHTVADVKKAQ